MSQTRLNTGDVVQKIQAAKFASPLWSLPEIDDPDNAPTVSWSVEARLNRMSDGVPLNISVKVVTALRDQSHTTEMVFFVALISIREVVEAIRLTFPQYQLPEDFKQYV